MNRNVVLAGWVLLMTGVVWGQGKSATTQPVSQRTGVANPVIESLNSMPKDLWPVKGETVTRQQLRDKWIAANLKKDMVIKGVVGWVASAEERQLPIFNPGPRPAGARGLKPDSIKSVQAVGLECGTIEVWGQPVTVRARANVDVYATTGAKWTHETQLSIDGPLESVQASGGSVIINMGLCKLSPTKATPKTPARPATAPATEPSYTFPKNGSQL
jgi:hypothetical protein